MKKFYILFLLLIVGSTTTFAQGARSNVKKISGEPVAKKVFKNKQRELYNHWSVELNVGSNKPIAPFADGYYASDPNRFSNFGVMNHYGLGVRYMASNIFGLKVGVNYDKISNVSSSESPEFKVTLYTATFEGVLNLGRLSRFETFTSRLGLLAHAGLQTSYKKVDNRVSTPGLYNTIGQTKEQDGGIVFGITPEFKLNKRISITADFSMFTNFRQHINWDGSKNNDKNLNGTIHNTTLGIILALGQQSEKVHADWYILPQENTADEETKKRLDDVENKVKDADKDGVPDYLDLEKNTVIGAIVDSKGRTIDTVKNTQQSQFNPDAVAAANNISKENFAVNQNVINELIEKGYFNIFFDISKDYPNGSSTQNVYQIIHYLKENPNSKIKLVGHTDKTGDLEANKDLSERRAKSIFNLITASGIKEDRISIEGLGVDNNVPSDVRAGNNMARRVSIIIVQK
jgi:OmpA-OmpF porin, OOP family